MPAADPRDARLHAGRELLRARGLDGADAAIAALEQAFASDPAVGVAVAARLGERVSEDSVAALRRMETGAAGDKTLRREVRRSLYRLAQKGVAAAERPAAEAPPPPVLGGPEPEGLISPCDAQGDRLLWILKPRTGGGLFHLSLLVNEPAGLKEAVLAEVNRKALRGLRDELAKRHELRLVEVDWRYCDWIGAEGFERARRRGETGEAVASYPQLRLQLFQSPAEPQPAPIGRFLDPAAGADAASVAASASLFEEPDLAWWFLPEPVLAPWLARYHDLKASPIVLDRFQQVSRVDEIVGDALREIFSGEGAAAWRRRLEEIAWFLWKTGREKSARQAHAAALAVSASQTGGKGIPFFEELVRRSFGMVFAREAEREQEAEASSVLVTPDQIRAQQARGPRGRIR